MATLIGEGIIERGFFDPALVNETAVYAGWILTVASAYLTISRKHKPGKLCTATSCVASGSS